VLDTHNMPRASAMAEETSGLDFRDVVNFLWRRWKFIASVAAFVVLAAAVYVARQTPLYTASAQMLLDPRKEKIAGQEAFLTEMAYDQFALESQISIIRSTALLRRVVEKEHLVGDPEFGVDAVVGTGALASIRALFSPPEQKAAGRASDDAIASAARLHRAVEAVKRSLAVTRAQGEGLVLTIAFTSPDPAKAARLANAVADAYVVDKLDARFDAAQRASAWLADRIAELRQQLRASEEAVARFRAENNLSGATSYTSLSQEQLGQLNARLVGARSETAEKKARLDILHKIEARGDNIAGLPDVANSGSLGDLRKQLADLSRQEADLLARYSGNHPAVVNLRAQIADVRRSVAAEIQRVAANIRNDFEFAKARQDAVERTLREATGQTDLDATNAITLRELERTAAVNKSMFEDFLQRAKITQEQSTFEARDARVITPAMPPGGPSYPKKMLILLGALAGGLAIGGVGAFALEKLSNGFMTPREVEDALALPLLASFSKIDARELIVDGSALSIPEYLAVKPLSRFNEAFRSLRGAVQMCDVDHPPKVLQFTSTIPKEGKSTLALGFAASAAQSGVKVLLIDGDLRQPSVSHSLKAEKKSGLVDYLLGDAELQSVLIYDDKLRIWGLPAGRKAQNPSDLLASERMKALIAAFREKFDLVIIDSPPIGPVIDPLIVSRIVDKVVYIVRWASTVREMVAHSVDRFGGHSKVAGIVFNQVIDAQAQKYGKHAYSYYYGVRDYNQYYTE